MLHRKLIAVITALAVIILFGASGYSVIEGWPPLDSLYMTIITLSSVGFMEVHPLSDYGRIFTILLILSGSGVLVYGISVITAFVVEGELTDVLRRRAMTGKIEKMNGHYIVCGADQTGRYVIEELLKTGRDFVIIEKDPIKVKGFMNKGLLCIEGDGSHEAVLMKAGITTAKGFITSLHSDAENLLVVITAKRLNPSLRVISKAVEEESEQKIRIVGADGVVMPNAIGGLRMASELIRPSVVGFLDVMLRVKDKTIRMDEIEIAAGSPLSGKSLSVSGIAGIEGVSVVAIRTPQHEQYTFNPSGDTILSENTVLILMGDVEKMRKIPGFAQTAAI